MKRIGMFLAVAILVGTAWTSAVHAATAWYTCEITAIGLSSVGTLFVQLTDLGGVSSDLNVLVNTDITAGTFPPKASSRRYS